MSNQEQGRTIMCRGVRGATIAEANSRQAIHTAIRELVTTILEVNGIEQDDLASAIFTTTPDLDAAFPAEAVRHMGWEYVPMLGAVEMGKQAAPGRRIRALLHWNTTKGRREIKH